MAKKKNRRQDDAADDLLIAVGEWVEANGGRATVAGPISVMRFPNEKEATYHVVVKCLGKAPTPSEESK